MHDARLRRLASIGLLAGAINAPGCIAFYRASPVTITVTDAESNTPVADALVELRYSYVLCLNPPKPVSGVTDADGRVHIGATTFESKTWRVSAEGFLPAEFGFGSEPSAARPDGSPLEFRLYRGPQPEIVIVVPDGYQGPLLVDRVPSEGWIQERPGARRFVFAASELGYVRIDASPLLLRTHDLRVVRQDGTPIQRARDMYDDGVALRPVDADEGRFIFVIGTPADVQPLRDVVAPVIRGDATRARDHDAIDRLFATRREASERRDAGTGGE